MKTIDEPGRISPSAPLRSGVNEEAPGSSSSADSPRSLEDGALVGRRYRIVRFIAAGGMGEVYEARDEELGALVALKAIRGERAGDARATERFRREIALARRVTHEHVARVFDVGFHHGRVFLTMELLAGESLAERIARGPLREDEALPLVEHMCAALDAAHDAGVVHRDFKSSNVMLVPAADGTRCVVTDFGLARAAEDPSQSLSRDTALLGSPPYMAPEQVEGGDITAATDHYALGIVMYEMVTGTLPFVADQPLTVALMRLTRDPEPPRARMPALSAAWNDTILRLLARDPAARFARAQDVIDALAGRNVAAAPPATRRSPPRRARQMGAIAAAVIAVGAGGWALRAQYMQRAHSTSAARADTAEVRKSLAVLAFAPAAGERDTTHAAALDATLTQAFTAQLAAGDAFRVVPPERAARARHELALEAPADATKPEGMARLRKSLGADRVVVGTYKAVAPEGTLQVDVVVKEGADTVASARLTGPGSDARELAMLATRELRAKLGVREPTQEEATFARGALPPDDAAARFYAQGVFEVSRFQYAEGRALLEKATAAAPNFAPAFAALASALGALGRDEEAAALADKALSLAGNLSRATRLSIEADGFRLRSDFEHAAAVYQALYTFYPDDVDYGVSLLRSQTKAGRPKDALATLEQLRKLPPELVSDPRIDVEEARAAHSVSDYPRCLQAATRALDEGKKRENFVLVGQAGYFYSIALVSLGKPREGFDALMAAREASLRVGDVYNLGVLQSPLQNFHFARGDFATARREMTEVEASLSAMGQTYYAAASRGALAQIDVAEGDFTHAHDRFQDAFTALRRVNGTHALGGMLPNFAEVEAARGDFASADKACDEAAVIVQKSGRKGAEAGLLLVRASVARLRGDMEKARQHDERALAIEREIGFDSGVANAQIALAERLALRGEFATARTNLEDAARTKEKLDEPFPALEVKLLRARLAVYEHHWEEAERLALECEPGFHAAGAHGAEAQALEARARALAATHRAPEAKLLMARALELTEGRGNTELVLALRTTRAFIAGDATALSTLAAEARRDEFAVRALAADAARASLQGGDPREKVRADAQKRGLSGIAATFGL